MGHDVQLCNAHIMCEYMAACAALGGNINRSVDNLPPFSFDRTPNIKLKEEEQQEIALQILEFYFTKKLK